MVACCSSAFFDSRPALLGPSFERFFVSLCCPLNRLLPTPARLTQQSPNMVTMIADAKAPVNHFCHAACRPDIASKAIGFGPLANKVGISAFCSIVKRGERPLGGCALRASLPPARPRLSH